MTAKEIAKEIFNTVKFYVIEWADSENEERDEAILTLAKEIKSKIENGKHQES